MIERIPQSPNLEKSSEIKRIFSSTENGELVPLVPDAIVVFSGSITAVSGERAGHEGYKSPSYAELDNKELASGGKARVIAAAEASKYFPEATLLTNSRDSSPESERPTHAKVYKQELIDLGVDEDSIEIEEDSKATIDGLAETIRIAEELHPQWQNIVLITNEYHTKRMQKMIEMLPELISKIDTTRQEQVTQFFAAGKQLHVVSAEDILVLRNEHYRTLIERVKQTDAYKRRVEAEAKGLRDLEKGEYDLNLPSTN